MKHIGRFNIALLSKWIWRILVEKDNLWICLLINRYGNMSYNILANSSYENVVKRKQSLWWRDISTIGSVFSWNLNWFNEFISGKIGDGDIIGFWLHCWIGVKPLVNVFRDLFGSLATSHVKIKTMGDWNGNSWLWNLSDSVVTLSVQARKQLTKLEQILVMVHPKKMGTDLFVWKLYESGFSMANSYKWINSFNERVQLLSLRF